MPQDQTVANCIITAKPIYAVPKLKSVHPIDAIWSKLPWQDVEPMEIDQWMKIAHPRFVPRTQAKLAYDDQAIYLIFRVEDRYVKAEMTSYQDIVSLESCVEFFFCPGEDPTHGFFNLEFNCAGTFLFRHQKALHTNVTEVDWADASKLEVKTSLPGIVTPEIDSPLTWTLEVRLPLEAIEPYCPLQRPEPGKRWLANLTKTAQGNTSNTHFFTWSGIPPQAPIQMFGQPEHFGTLLFVD